MRYTHGMYLLAVKSDAIVHVSMRTYIVYCDIVGTKNDVILCNLRYM